MVYADAVRPALARMSLEPVLAFDEEVGAYFIHIRAQRTKSFRAMWIEPRRVRGLAESFERLGWVGEWARMVQTGEWDEFRRQARLKLLAPTTTPDDHDDR